MPCRGCRAGRALSRLQLARRLRVFVGCELAREEGVSVVQGAYDDVSCLPVLLNVVNLSVLLLRKGSPPGELMFVGLCVYEVKSKVR